MTARTPVSTRRDTQLATLGLVAVVMVAAALMAVLLSFLSAQAPGLFRLPGVSGHGTVSPAALAASTFPYRHVTVQADTEFAGRVIVTFDDGTGQPAAQVLRSLPVSGSVYDSGESSQERCDTNDLCWGGVEHHSHTGCHGPHHLSGCGVCHHRQSHHPCHHELPGIRVPH